MQTQKNPTKLRLLISSPLICFAIGCVKIYVLLKIAITSRHFILKVPGKVLTHRLIH
jgi:hypothetical protein